MKAQDREQATAAVKTEVIASHQEENRPSRRAFVPGVRAPVGPNVQFGTDLRAIWIFVASIADKIICGSMGYGDRRFCKGTGKTLHFISGRKFPNPRFRADSTQVEA
jgi:hypothetical protein